jgi:hypothetical protein
MDLYSYANGDPVNNVDPDGRMASAYTRGELGSFISHQVGFGLTTAAGSMSPGVVQNTFAYAAGAYHLGGDLGNPSFMGHAAANVPVGMYLEIDRYTQVRMAQGYSEFSARVGAASYGVVMPLIGVYEAGTGTDFVTGQKVDRSLTDNLLKVNSGLLYSAGPYAASTRLARTAAPTAISPPPIPAASRAGNAAFEKMLQAGQAADRGGLTQAGRALEKHGSRGGVFPQATGNVAAKNAQGQQVLQEILSSQNQTISPNRFGGRDIFDAATGRGVRYDGNGKMMGFLEP